MFCNVRVPKTAAMFHKNKFIKLFSFSDDLCRVFDKSIGIINRQQSISFFRQMYLNHTATAAPLRLCDCRISEPVFVARFSQAWLIEADFCSSVLSELCRFPLLNYSVFVVVADRLRVLFSNSCLISLLANFRF